MINLTSNRGTYEHLGNIEETSLDEVIQYKKQSHKAFTSRSINSVSNRIQHLQAFLQEYKKNSLRIAESISMEIGKPITQSLADIDYDIGYIQRHLDHADEILKPEIIHETEKEIHTMYYEPKGIATVISPRNYPSSQFIRQTIPPLLAGNTILYKCSSSCMWTGKLISDLIIRHLPKGVFIPVYGDSTIGQALIDLATDLTIFTGSSGVGKMISLTNGLQMETSHLELGGSAPGIICEDASIDKAMMQTIDYFRVRHSGQICDGLKRLIVHESRLYELVDNLKQYFGNLHIGNPLDPITGLGPVINSKALDNITAQIHQSIDGKEIQIVELGQCDTTPGAFMKLTLLIGNGLIGSPVMKEEIFGPVLPIVSFKTIDEAIALANDTIFGLGGYLWTKNNQTIDYISSMVKTGNINVNNTNYVIPQIPFGGYTPSSGNYREHGWIGLRGYCETKVVSKGKI